MRADHLAALIAIAMIVVSQSAASQMPSVIFSNVSSSPSSDVPGLPGVKFGSSSTVFSQPGGSASGDLWVFRAGASGQVVIVGDGIDGTRARVAIRVPVPAFFDNTVIFESLRPRTGVSDAGSVAFAADTTAPAGSDEIVARGVLVTEGENQFYQFDLLSRESLQLPGHPPGVEVGAEARYIHMLNDDTVAVLGRAAAGGGAAFLCGAEDGGRILVQSYVTVPDDQIAQPPRPIDGSITMFRIDATGQTYMYSAFLAGGGFVTTVNNVVVAEYGRALPGGYPGVFLNLDLDGGDPSVSPYHGHYAFRSRISTASDAVIVDDAVVAVTGDPIVFGSSDVFGDNMFGAHTTFAMNSVNSRGDYVLVGHVNIAPTNRPQVAVWNRRVILFREGDAVDLDGDGLGNDGYYLGYIDDDYNGYITDNGRMYFVARLRSTPTGPDGPSAFLWHPIPNPGDPNCDGAIDFFDVDAFLLALFDPTAFAAAHPGCFIENADLDRSGRVDFFDIDPFVNCLFGGCGVQIP